MADNTVSSKEMIEVLDKIRDEILEYIDDLDIATEICDIFDKYTNQKSISDEKGNDLYERALNAFRGYSGQDVNNEIYDTFNKLLSLDNHPLEVSKDIDGNICIGYKDGWIDDVYCFKGVVGRGKTLTEAANNYCKLISGKTIVFLNENNREEVKVLF